MTSSTFYRFDALHPQHSRVLMSAAWIVPDINQQSCSTEKEPLVSVAAPHADNLIQAVASGKGEEV